MKRLLKVLLVDDCSATNFVHKLVIEEYGCASSVDEVGNGVEALAYLSTEREGEFPQPDLIFLDINMPRMDGWEFLKHYHDLPANQKGGAVVIMLTTSVNPDDRSGAVNSGEVKAFTNKPLDEHKLTEVLQEFFPECVRPEFVK